MSKISELSDGGSLLPTDFLIAVRSGGNVKVQADQTEFDRIRLGDNEKIELGNSQDLQIYSDGTNSFIKESGVGHLYVQATNLRFKSLAGENFMALNEDGSVSAYYDNALRLATTASGIDVTSNVSLNSATTAPVLKLSNNSDAISAGDNLGLIEFYSGDDSGGGNAVKSTISTVQPAASPVSGELVFKTSESTGSLTERLRIKEEGIDVTGSVTADGLIHTGDSDTFIKFLDNRIYADRGGVRVLDFETNSSKINSADSVFIQTGSTTKNRIKVDAGGDISFYEDQGVTPKLFWDASAESLGIGDQSPTNGNLTIRAASTIGTKNGHIMLTGDSASVGQGPQIAFSESGNGSNWVGGTIGFTRTGGSGVGDLLFSTRQSAGDANTAATEVLRLTSTGALLLHPNNISRGLKITSGTTEAIGSDTTYDTIAASYGKHIFKTDGVERMRISSGSVSVGTTDDAPGVADTNVGVALNSGRVFASAESDYALNLNRNTSDGDILRFRKDGTTIGSLGTNSGKMYLGTGSANIRFRDDLTAIVPTDSDGSNSDADLDLGYSTIRWRDIYTSGGIYLGGTTSANKLSDFEEGTFTPVMENVTGWSGSSGVSGNYTKIGNTVHVFISMTSNVALTGTPTNKITGLPFSSDLNERCSNVSISRMFGIGLTTTDYIAGVTLSEINFSYVNGDNNVNNLTHSGSTLRITLSATYTTAA